MNKKDAEDADALAEMLRQMGMNIEDTPKKDKTEKRSVAEYVAEITSLNQRMQKL